MYISAITGLEISIKARSGKLTLPAEPRLWLSTVLKFHHIDVLPLSLEISTCAAELPPIHKDPCDRFIIATALKYEMPVVTEDRHFSGYGITVLT